MVLHLNRDHEITLLEKPSSFENKNKGVSGLNCPHAINNLAKKQNQIVFCFYYRRLGMSYIFSSVHIVTN